MRINVYGEELTCETEIVSKKIEDGRMFYAVRLFLKSSPALHHMPTDDDRSAITFWVPWRADCGNMPHALEAAASAIHDAAKRLRGRICKNQEQAGQAERA